MKTNTVFVQAQRHFLRGEYGRSIMGFGNALESGMDADKIRVPLGLAYFKNSNFSEAAAEFSRALDLDPINDHVLFLRGMAYFNNGEMDKAIDDFNASIGLNNRSGFAYVARSLASQAMHWDAEAETDLKSAVALADVEVELFIREYCIAPALRSLALSLFDVGKEAWGKEQWERRSSNATH